VADKKLLLIEEKKPPVLIAAVLAVLVLGGGAFWWLDYQSRHQASQAVALTPEAKGYVKNLALSEVQMQANESYLKQAVVEIEGKITNNGNRAVKLVEIYCVFYDPYGQVVLRERMAIAGRKMGDLEPGGTKSFRLPFDSLPESWNKQMPQLVIAQILFG